MASSKPQIELTSIQRRTSNDSGAPAAYVNAASELPPPDYSGQSQSAVFKLSF